MNRILACLGISLVVALASASAAELSQKMKDTTSVVWMGLDYSMMRMIGTEKTILVPDLLFQNMPARWNDLFLDERIEGVAGALKRRVQIDIEAVTERNKGISTNQVVLSGSSKDAAKESHITAEEISAAVKSLRSKHEKGLAMVFIVDRFVSESKLVSMPAKTNAKFPPAYISHAGAVYVIFFDLATREVLSAKREVRVIGTGGSFRNFWFGPIKDIDSELSQYRE